MQKKSIKVLFTGLAVTILFSSCSSLRLTADYDKTNDFSKYKTFEFYGWADESDKVLNDMDKKRIEDSFANELYRRGLSLVNSGGDLVVTLFVVLEQKTATTAETSYKGTYGYYGHYYGYGPGWGWGPSYTTTVRSYNYVVGTLVCDIFDQKEQKLVWEGIASKTVDENPATREKNIPRIVRALMNRYPVSPVKQ